MSKDSSRKTGRSAVGAAVVSITLAAIVLALPAFWRPPYTWSPLGVEPAAAEEDGGGGMAGMHHMGGGAPKKGKATSVFFVDPRRQQMIGVKKEVVKVRPLTKVIRTVGLVEFDETKVKHVHTKVSGWIKDVYADFTWQYVKKGDPLFSIYSPELVATEEELLLALKYQDILVGSRIGEIAEDALALVESTRRRLELWDVSRDQIREIERTGKVKKYLVIHSPISGYITYKDAFTDMYITPKTRVYTVADYNTVWIYAELYEDELNYVHLGQEAEVTVDSLPGRRFQGRVTYILPEVHPQTRTVRVRFEFPNPDLKLLQGMYGDVVLRSPIGERLAVPDSAVLRTGKESLVFVDKGEGYLELRRIETGTKVGDYYVVLKGLKAGERVVTSANFLIDSESQLRNVIASWNEDEPASASEDAGGKEGMEHGAPGAEGAPGHVGMGNGGGSTGMPTQGAEPKGGAVEHAPMKEGASGHEGMEPSGRGDEEGAR